MLLFYVFNLCMTEYLFHLIPLLNEYYFLLVSSSNDTSHVASTTLRQMLKSRGARSSTHPRRCPHWVTMRSRFHLPLQTTRRASQSSFSAASCCERVRSNSQAQRRRACGLPTAAPIRMRAKAAAAMAVVADEACRVRPTSSGGRNTKLLCGTKGEILFI